MPILDLAQTARPGLQPMVVHRNDRDKPWAGFPQSSIRRVVPVQVEQAPNPYPASTLFYGVGRDKEHALPMETRYNSPAIREWLSVQAWPFLVQKLPQPLVINMNTGSQNPFHTRPNIDAPPSSSVGTAMVLMGGKSFSPGLAKLVL